MDSGSAHRGAHPLPHHTHGQGVSLAPLYSPSSPSPSSRDPSFPPQARPCPHLGQPLTDPRPFMPHPTSTSANGFAGVAQLPRPNLTRHLPNPMSPQGGSPGAQARHAGAVATNQGPPSDTERPPIERPSLAMDYATHVQDEFIRQTSLDGLGYSASQLLAAAQHQHQPFGTLGYYSGAPLGPAPSLAGHNRERAFANASYRFLAEVGGTVGASTTTATTGAGSSNSPRRRHPPSHSRSTNSNGLFTDHPSIQGPSFSSADRRRSRLQARLRRGMTQQGDDDMGSAMSPGLSPPYWVHAQGAGRPLDDDEESPDDEQSFYAQSVRVAARHYSRRAVGFRVNIAALESLQIDDLPDGERMCPICYNDYGVEGPEGINEAPLRIPRCKHVFGDHCIKKWLTQKHTCPYCRDTVPGQDDTEHASSSSGPASSPSQNRSRAPGSALSEAVLNMMGPDAQNITTLADAAQYRWMQSRQRVENFRRATTRAHPHPSDSEEHQRRTRQRLNSDDSSQRPGSGGDAEAATINDGHTEHHPMFGHVWQTSQRVPAIETLTSPRVSGLGSTDQRARETQLTTQPQPQLFPPMSYSPMYQAMFAHSPVAPLRDMPLGLDTTEGLGYPYLSTLGSSAIHSAAGPGRVPSYPSRSTNSMVPGIGLQPSAPTHGHDGVTPVDTLPPSPNSSQATEGEAVATEEPAVELRQRHGTHIHNAAEAQGRGRMW